jgi:pimeloyl-ACP methyl ester carboxylesterase
MPMAAPRLHIEVDGEGPTIVFAHGFGGSARNFRAQARALAVRFRVVRFDARGHARSEAPNDPEAYRPEAFVEDVARVLDEVGASAAVIAALSMGAGIALRFALAYPQRTRALVLASFPAGRVPGSVQSDSAPVRLRPAMGVATRNKSGSSLSAVAGAFADAIEREGLEAAGAHFVWGPDSGLEPRAAKLIRQGFLEHDPRALAYTLRGLIAAQPSPAALVHVLPTVTQPVLLIVGEHDRSALEASRVLADGLLNARLVVIRDAGHLVNIAQPAAFNAAVDAFLRDDRLAGE